MKKIYLALGFTAVLLLTGGAVEVMKVRLVELAVRNSNRKLCRKKLFMMTQYQWNTSMR